MIAVAQGRLQSQNPASPHSDTALEIRYRIVQTITRPSHYFTQGLATDSNATWESSGLYRRSYLVKRDKRSQRIQARFDFPRNQFAEGIAVIGDSLYGLTWRSNTAYRWNKQTLAIKQRFHLDGEGWGMTDWGGQLVTSDGSATLKFRNANDFTTERTLQINLQGRPQHQLNDLTSDKQFIWANVWRHNHILRIDPHSGRVNGYLDLTELSRENPNPNPEAVLNGIAWDHDQETLWVTGKLWTKLYQLQIIP